MAGKYETVLTSIQDAIDTFTKSIPSTQRAILKEVNDQLRRLDVDGKGSIKSTVKNLGIVNSIRTKLRGIILNNGYLENVQEFLGAFNTVTIAQNEFWKTIEPKFKPRPLLREIRKQSIQTTIDSLTEGGISANIIDPISSILRTNITSGGSYADFADMIRTQIVGQTINGVKTPGQLSKYVNLVANDAIQEYNAQYSHIVSGDLGFEWFAYVGTDIETSRPFCIGMTERRYFHESEIPALLAAEDLTYIDRKTNERKPVPIYDKTGLPGGLKAGTNAENFPIRRGGWNCGHQVRPTFEKSVPADIVARVKATAAYQRYKPVTV